MRTKTPNLHILLSLGRMTDKERAEFATHVNELAPTSHLYTQNPHMQAAVTEMTSYGTQLGAADIKVGSIESQLSLSKESRIELRNSFDKSMGVLTSLIENSATTAEEAASMGFSNVRIGKAAPLPLTPPDGVDVKIGKKHREVKVVAKTTAEHGRFGAQTSTDPIGPATWQDMVGSGKTRVITGYPSGTLLWVRFRELRGRTASDWCTPVPVKIP